LAKRFNPRRRPIIQKKFPSFNINPSNPPKNFKKGPLKKGGTFGD